MLFIFSKIIVLGMDLGTSFVAFHILSERRVIRHIGLSGITGFLVCGLTAVYVLEYFEESTILPLVKHRLGGNCSMSQIKIGDDSALCFNPSLHKLKDCVAAVGTLALEHWSIDICHAIACAVKLVVIGAVGKAE